MLPEGTGVIYFKALFKLLQSLQNLCRTVSVLIFAEAIN